MKHPRYIGWYDGSPTSAGNVTLCYWNHVVNTFASIGQDANDPRRYTAEHYIEAVERMINAHHAVNGDRRFIVDLPMAEVWYDANGQIIFKENAWIEQVVQALDANPFIIAWYAADEPELWGEINDRPRISVLHLGSRYRAIKKHSSKPVICVFCDPDLTEEMAEDSIGWSHPKCFDIYGFDYYPYRTQRDLPIYPTACRESTIQRMIKAGRGNSMMFVGQGSGTAEFGTRPPELEEMAKLYEEWTHRSHPGSRYAFLLWSWSYADTASKQIGNFLLEPGILSQHTNNRDGWTPRRPSLWRRLYCLLTR